MSIDNLVKRIRKIEEERDWNKFHNPKDLAIDISVEASELLELFLWKTPEEVLKAKKEQVKEELADILISCLNLADRLDLDVIKVIDDKLDEIEKKYPAEKFKGKVEKYNEL